MKVGFSQRNITPPPGLLLGGYAVTRKSTGAHDPICCKTVIFEQLQDLYVLMSMDLLCIDDALYQRIAARLQSLGVAPNRLLICATHTHSGPKGATTNEGVLSGLNEIFGEANPDFIEQIVLLVMESFHEAYSRMEDFRIRIGRTATPPIGTERHNNTPIEGLLTVAEILTDSGLRLIIYNFPCHPTVMSAQNVEMSADFPGYISSLLGCDMAVFLNGACGDISTRFVRRESSFAECERLASLVVDSIQSLLNGLEWHSATPITGNCRRVRLSAKDIESESSAAARLETLNAEWQAGIARNESSDRIRILKSFVEGAETNLQLTHVLKGVSFFELPVCVFTFCGFKFATIPGELFSTLSPSKDVSIIGYSNGYNLYIADTTAYSQGYYEALSSVFAEGEGEKLRDVLNQMCSIL